MGSQIISFFFTKYVKLLKSGKLNLATFQNISVF